VLGFIVLGMLGGSMPVTGSVPTQVSARKVLRGASGKWITAARSGMQGGAALTHQLAVVGRPRWSQTDNAPVGGEPTQVTCT
jgi:hypothetical protein